MKALRVLLVSLMGIALSAHGSVIIVGTRVIYPAGARDVSVRLLNRGDRPALVQAWLDRGDPKSTPDTVSVPFSLTPTLARVDPDRGQVLRLIYTGEPLPQDKESVFWLNVLEVPPKPTEADGANLIQFALRTRIKVFYRPKGFKDSYFDAARSVQWRLLRTGNGWSVEGRNSSPYFISFGSLSLRTDAKAADTLASATGGMISPAEMQRFDLGDIKPGITAGAHVVLRYVVVDDYGALTDTDAQLEVPDAANGDAASAISTKPPQRK